MGYNAKGTNAQWNARRDKNTQRAQRRREAEQRRQDQERRAQRNLQSEFERAAEQGFHTLVANVIHAVSLLGHIQDPAVQQSV